MASYQQQLSILHSDSLTSFFTKMDVEFQPMILEFGYAEGSGFSTAISFCFRPEGPSKFYSFFVHDPSQFPSSDKFLNMYLSFSSDANDRFLDASKGISINLTEAQEGCLEFSFSDFQKAEIRNAIDTDKLCEETKYCPSFYNQAFCLDHCIQGNLSLSEEWKMHRYTDTMTHLKLNRI